MDELSTSDRQLLAALRGADEPTEADAMRVKGAVLRSVTVGAASLAGIAATEAASAATLGATSAAGATAAGTGAGAIGTGAAVAGASVSGAAVSGATVAGGAVVGGAALTAQAAGVGLGVKLGGIVLGGAALVGGGYYVSQEAPEPAAVPIVVEAPAALDHNTERSAVRLDRAEPSPEAEEPSAAVNVKEVNVKEVEQLPEVSPTPAVARPKAKAAASSAPNLDVELQLLRQAQQALGRGDARSALASLGEHRRRFPQGVLASERRATYAIALCQAGQVHRGRVLAQRFLSTQSSSPMATRMRSACGLEDGSKD